jgi:hypothetical protein
MDVTNGTRQSGSFNATGEQLHDGGCGSSRPQLAALILSPVADKDSSEMQAIAAQDLTKVN